MDKNSRKHIANNQIAEASHSLPVLTLHVNRLNSPINKNWQNRLKKNKIQLYAFYKRLI